MAEMYSSYWVNFVNTGDPNGNGLPMWQPFAADRPVTMTIGRTSGPIPLAEPQRLEWYRALLDP
jgi:carboxylesterase type B